MEQHEKRKALRVTCSIGLHLQGEWTMVRARVVDAGRLGARLRVPLRELGLEHTAGTTAVASHIRQLLTRDVVAHLRPEMLGSLVQRQVHAVRIGERNFESDDVDIGVEFDRPLTRLDAAALGLPIPMEGESLEDAEAGTEGKLPQTREPKPVSGGPTQGNAYADLRFALLVKKSDLGTDTGADVPTVS